MPKVVVSTLAALSPARFYDDRFDPAAPVETGVREDNFSFRGRAMRPGRSN
jgi:hypothetical protein